MKVNYGIRTQSSPFALGAFGTGVPVAWSSIQEKEDFAENR